MSTGVPKSSQGAWAAIIRIKSASPESIRVPFHVSSSVEVIVRWGPRFKSAANFPSSNTRWSITWPGYEAAMP